MEEKSLQEQYVEKKEEIKRKYELPIRLLGIANGVDVGVAFDMLEANFRHGEAKADYKYINEEEAQKDFDELRELSRQRAIELGLIVE